MGNMFALERGTGMMVLVNGSQTNTALQFVGDPDTGLFHPSANVLEVTAGGAATGTIRMRTGSGVIASFGVSNADGFWNFTAAGHVLVVDETRLIGTRTGNRPNKIYVASTVCVGRALVQHCVHLMTTCVALTIHNGANTGTLTNSPTTGNPEVWAQVNNNGCTYVVPLWRLT